MTPKCPDCKRDQDDCCCKDEIESLRQQLAATLNKLEMAEACLAGDNALIAGLKNDLAAATTDPKESK